ncbi:MAG: FGGY-family carbohydrate kinase, partial [Ginsengibacter sp.]
QKNDYHTWVRQEGIFEKLAPIVSCKNVFAPSFPVGDYAVGIGLHDSSAALIPYLVNFHEPFILISTGTWCISLNPFNHSPLTKEELENDCLCYMTYESKPVKASRLFAGNEHEQQVKRIAAHFNMNVARFRTMEFNAEIIAMLKRDHKQGAQDPDENILKNSLFEKRNLDDFTNDEEAYHQLMLDIAAQQYVSTQLVLKGTEVKRIFVDGGFGKNVIYMHLLAAAFPGIEVFAASMAQATAMGAALAIHESWNPKPLPNDVIQLKYFSANQDKS